MTATSPLIRRAETLLPTAMVEKLAVAMADPAWNLCDSFVYSSLLALGVEGDLLPAVLAQRTGLTIELVRGSIQRLASWGLLVLTDDWVPDLPPAPDEQSLDAAQFPPPCRCETDGIPPEGCYWDQFTSEDDDKPRALEAPL